MLLECEIWGDLMTNVGAYREGHTQLFNLIPFLPTDKFPLALQCRQVCLPVSARTVHSGCPTVKAMMMITLFFLLMTSLVHAAVNTPVIPCTSEDNCLSFPSSSRCLPVSPNAGGAACVLDYGYNSTGWCACGPEPCVLLTTKNKTSLKQWLMIGDSISMGLQSAAASASENEWEITHAPSFNSGSQNNDNAHWHNLCSIGWLGSEPHRWDVITINAGLHDLAYPDNEHLSLISYEKYLKLTLPLILNAVKPTTSVIWARTTPVPTNPTPQCILIPGRLETNVQSYNLVADTVIANIASKQLISCDLHKVITNVCGTVYSSCNISQCAGPHFTSEGFDLLGKALANCVMTNT